ncbi:branched-chain amino acid ABC transporter permease [Mongoliimonas terrestris]|uniref:branched-chain amino acid ABC transporter permease n=1 Tax=Mongoliimonas terrestris TaxID=1709001 RepID=UPI000949A1C9|nr:branched-chain amino acid ABC transporter permease [Mongoliimonas terrestris]
MRRLATWFVRLLAGLILALALTGCDGLDDGQARLCVAVVPALEPTGALVIRSVTADPSAPHAVRVDYTIADPASDRSLRVGTVRCAFGGGLFDTDRQPPVAVEHDGALLSGARLLVLRRFWLGDREAMAEGAARLDIRAIERPLLPVPVTAETGLALQQALNALPRAAVYAVLAAAFALVHGLLNRINLAFGCIAVAGAFAAVGVVTVYDRAWTITDPMVALVALAAVVLVAGAQGALLGTVIGTAVFRPLRHAGPRAFLIATVGLALALSEAVRLVAGTGERWIQPMLATPILIASGGYRATLTVFQVLEVLFAGVLLVALVALMTRSRFGRDWRAAADDPLMARLLGSDVERTATIAFALSALLAGIAGAADALHYGHASAGAWLTLTLKTLMAALLGGIGSVRGAIAGGLLLGVAEVAWAATMPLDQRDIAVMGGLVLLLVFRPDGLFGVGRAAGDSGDARWRSMGSS